jgi:hypothetical protein
LVNRGRNFKAFNLLDDALEYLEVTLDAVPIKEIVVRNSSSSKITPI